MISGLGSQGIFVLEKGILTTEGPFCHSVLRFPPNRAMSKPEQTLQEASSPIVVPGKFRSSKTPEEMAQQEEIDSRSIYIGNVDYHTTPEELENYFNSYGTVNRVTILFDRFTGYPKGYAYVEFELKDSVGVAVEKLDKSVFKGRTISVVAKRTNLPGFRKRGSFRGRGRGRGRGSLRGRGSRDSSKGRTDQQGDHEDSTGNNYQGQTTETIANE